MSVNPERLTKFDRTEDELFRFLFFSVAVAGKTAKQVAIKVNSFFKDVPDARWYLGYLLGRRELVGALEAQRMGKYRCIAGFVEDYIFQAPDLTTCTVEDLEKLRGVGPKTARMFLLHSRPNQRFAVLDTHVLKFLKEMFPSRAHLIPKATPTGKKYKQIEALWFEYIQHVEDCVSVSDVREKVLCSKGMIHLKGEWVDERFKLDIAAFDLDLWRLYSGNADDYVD